jgi:hypothetical protein
MNNGKSIKETNRTSNKINNGDMGIINCIATTMSPKYIKTTWYVKEHILLMIFVIVVPA